MEIQIENKKNLYKAVLVLIIILCVYFAVKAFSIFNNGNKWDKDGIESTIVITGHGEVNAVPDIATISFSITKEAKTVKEAQAVVTEIEGKVLSFLEENKIEQKDIKTTNSSFYPKYKYDYRGAYYPQNSTITGYEVSESIEVKVRDIDNAGKLIEGIGALGVSNLNGPNFTIDKEETLQAEARKLAIDDAKAKAKQLADDLGIRLGKIVSFNENGNYPVPIFYGKATLDAELSVGSAPSLPVGENIISSDVSITYKIR